MENSWLSPHKKAVKSAYKRKGKVSRTDYYDARAQVRDATDFITVRELTDKEAEKYFIKEPNKPVEGETTDDTKATSEAIHYGTRRRRGRKKDNPNDIFAIALDYNGNKPDDIIGLAPNIKTQLNLKDLIQINNNNTVRAEFIATRKELEDPLVKQKHGAEFYDEHPALTPALLPIAMTEDGKVWPLPTHHTLILGQTGSGKSSPLYGIIRQLAPAVEAGIVKLYGIDPKDADIGFFKDTTLFEQIATTPEDAITIINKVRHSMDEQSRRLKPDYDKGEAGTSTTASKETPWVFLIIDELFGLKKDLDTMGREGKTAWSNLSQITAKGRSSGHFLIAASQYADQKNLDDLRTNIVNWIVLKQDSLYFNNLFLGEGASEHGYDSTKIPASNKANGYRYAGIGFVRGEDGIPIKVRFVHLGKGQFDLAKKYRKHGGGGYRNNAPNPNNGGTDYDPRTGYEQPTGYQRRRRQTANDPESGVISCPMNNTKKPNNETNKETDN